MDVAQLLAKVRADLEAMRRERESLDDRIRQAEGFIATAERYVEADTPTPTPAVAAGTELRRVPGREKTRIILTEILDRRMSPKAVREALTARGIEPDAGTEVKRLLWQLAKQGKVIRYPDAGEYGPVSATNGSGEREVALARLNF